MPSEELTDVDVARRLIETKHQIASHEATLYRVKHGIATSLDRAVDPHFQGQDKGRLLTDLVPTSDIRTSKGLTVFTAVATAAGIAQTVYCGLANFAELFTAAEGVLTAIAGGASVRWGRMTRTNRRRNAAIETELQKRADRYEKNEPHAATIERDTAMALTALGVAYETLNEELAHRLGVPMQWPMLDRAKALVEAHQKTLESMVSTLNPAPVPLEAPEAVISVETRHRTTSEHHFEIS